MRASSLLFFLAACALVACTAPSPSEPTLRHGGSSGSTSSSGGTTPDPTDDGTPASPSTSSSSGSSGSSGTNTTGTSSGGTTPPPPAGIGNLTPGTTTVTWTVAGKSRSIVLVVPSAITSQAVPLVIALHGNGDTASNFIATRGLAQLAESQKFVVAAPQGITQNIDVFGQQVNGVDWDAYRDTASGNIDLPLLDEIQSQLVKPGGQIDAKRVIVFGYSQGGYLGFRYGIDDASKLACAAVVAASSPLGPNYISNAMRKIPYALSIGTNDYGIDQARAAKAALESASFPLQYKEIVGAGHAPFPGTTGEPLDYCLGQSLP